MKRGLLLILLPFAIATSALAQSNPDVAASHARFRFGRLLVTPSIALTNAGLDDNVFNEADVNHPKSDFTMTVTPQTDAWLQVGRAWLTGTVKEDLVYYRTFATERSANSTSNATLFVPMNRLTVSVGGDYLNARDRPGFEIDARLQHHEGGVHGALEVRAFGKTFVALTARRTSVGFEGDSVFLGANLKQELNRTMTMSGVAIRHRITPLTDLTFTVDREQDRFAFSQIRDSDSTRIAAGLRADARLRGSAVIGYRDFHPLAPDVPGYKGATAAVDLSFAPLGSTRLGVQGLRDLQYSYDVEQPYYLETGTMVSLTQGLYGPLDGVIRIGARDLAYRGRIGASSSLLDRVDTIHSFGGGFGYRVGRAMRIGFIVDKEHRTSDLAGHGFDGLRGGTTVTYGF